MTGKRSVDTVGRQRATGIVLLAVLSVLLSACGVGLDAAPNVVKRKDVPFGLLRPIPTTTVPAHPAEYVTIYLDGSQRLVAVDRELPSPVTVTSVLRALGAGPTSAEAAEGLQSPISTAAPLVAVRRATTTVTVGVTAAFTKLAEEDQAIAVAQLVYTLTVVPGISSVSIRIDGKRAKVPTAKGSLRAGPLGRADYVTVAPI